MSLSFKISILFALSSFCLLPIVSIGQDSNKTKTFDSYRFNFSITLPENWIPFTEYEMDQLNSTIAKIFSEWRRPAIHQAFRLRDAEGFVDPPRIWIRVMELENEPTLESTKAEFLRDLPTEKGLQFSDPVFDSNLEAFIANAEVQQEGQLPQKNVIALFPMKRGMIKAFVFMAKEDADRHPTLPYQVLGGIKIYDDYKPAVAKRSPTGLIISLTAIGILVLIIWKSKPAKHEIGELPPNSPSASA